MWLAALLTPRNLLRMGGAIGLVVAVVAAQLGAQGPLIALLGLVSLAVVGWSFAVDALSQMRRGKEARAFAKVNGWTYEAAMPGVLSPLFTPPFDVSGSTYLHVVSGRFGGFDCYDGIYEWRVQIDEDASVTGRHRVAVVRLPDDLPRMMLVPDGLSARLGALFGGANARFESSEFNREWRVLADDPRVAHDMLSPRVMERLGRLGTRAPMLFEGGLGVRIDSDAEGIGSLADRLSGLIAVARFVPEHTVEDHGRLANSIGPLPSVATPGAMTRGYDPEMMAKDEEFLRTAKPRKAQKWIDAARGQGSVAQDPPAN